MADTPIDMNHLARYTGGDRTLNSEILRLFNSQLNGMVDQLLSVLRVWLLRLADHGHRNGDRVPQATP